MNATTFTQQELNKAIAAVDSGQTYAQAFLDYSNSDGAYGTFVEFQSAVIAALALRQSRQMQQTIAQAPTNGHSATVTAEAQPAEPAENTVNLNAGAPATPERAGEPDFKEIAMAAVARGETRILPILVGGKNPIIKWAHLPIHDVSPAEWQGLNTKWIEELAAAYPNANACTVARADEYLYIDEDKSEEFRAGFQTFAGEPFPRTHTTSARPNRRQSGWKQTEYSRKMLWNIVQGKTKDQMFSIRFHNLYVLAEGSVHPKGTAYTAVDDSPLMPIPDALVDYILSLVVNVTFERGQRVELNEDGAQKEGGNWFESFSLDEPFIHGDIDNTVKDFIWYYIKHKNVGDGGQLFEEIEKKFETNGCYEPDGQTPFNWNREQIRKKCFDKAKTITTGEQDRQAAMKEALSEATKIGEQAAALAQTMQPSTLKLNQQPDVPVAPAPKTSAVSAVLVDDDPNWQYALTREEYDEQLEKEYPVIPLKIGPGPSWDDEIMYGVVGEMVRKIAVYNEAHPAGIYLDFLVSLGSIIGHDPYFNVNSTRHCTNEFLARVGDTSKSRKGTGREEVNRVLSMIDPRWFTECSASGFGSAEAIIYNIRDDAVKQVRKQRSNTFENVPIQGVKDKRLMIREGELASVFQLAGKRESRADIVLRDGWDSVPLNNKVKGNTNGINNSASVQHPHISISADTTRHELMSKMPPGADSNGFGNRFLYCYVTRVKMCPQGGPIPDLIEEVERLGRAIALARCAGCVGLSTAARKLWGRMYQKLEEESSIGSTLACSMMARGPAHVRRLALILCLLDEPEAVGGFQVEVEHLRAAKAIWDYCAESTRFIFGGLTREQQSIHDWLTRIGSKTVSEITQQLFHKNRKVEWVRHQVNALIGANKATADGDKITAK